MGTPVSGPGQFSERTDKAVSGANTTLSNAAYGENKDYQEQRGGAAIGQSPGGMDFASMFGNPAQNVVGLGEDSTTETPVTDGADAGPGAGSEALQSNKAASTYAAVNMIALEFIANQPGSSDSARNLVRIMKASI